MRREERSNAYRKQKKKVAKKATRKALWTGRDRSARRCGGRSVFGTPCLWGVRFIDLNQSMMRPLAAAIITGAGAPFRAEVRLMGWSGRAPAPPAIEVGEGHQGQGPYDERNAGVVAIVGIDFWQELVPRCGSRQTWRHRARARRQRTSQQCSNLLRDVADGSGIAVSAGEHRVRCPAHRRHCPTANWRRFSARYGCRRSLALRPDADAFRTSRGDSAALESACSGG